MCKYGVGTTGNCRAGIVWTPQDRFAKYTNPGSVTTFYHDGKAKEESYTGQPTERTQKKRLVAPFDDSKAPFLKGK